MTALEEHLLFQMKAVGIPEPQREVTFCEGRKWRADFLWTEPVKLIVEVNGGTYTAKSGHNTCTGIRRDYEKGNFAQIVCGYKYLQFDSAMVTSGEAVGMVEAALGLVMLEFDGKEYVRVTMDKTFDESLQGIRREDGMYFTIGLVVSHPVCGIGQIIGTDHVNKSVLVDFSLGMHWVPISQLTLK